MSILPKTERRRRRLLFVMFLVLGVGTSGFLLLSAKSDQFNLYHTPSKIAELIKTSEFAKYYTPSKLLVDGKEIQQRVLRVGGMVVEKSLKRIGDGVTVEFVVTDYKHSTKIQYRGILPDMLKEGQAAVAEGLLDANGVLIANKVLAKHDEKYLPPEVAASLKEKGEAQKMGNTASPRVLINPEKRP